MIVWKTFHRAFLHIFWMVPKMMQRCVSVVLERRCGNIDCSSVIQIFAPFFLSSYVVVCLHGIFHYSGSGQENRRVYSFFVDLYYKLFGKEMMLLVQLSSAWTYLKSSFNVLIAMLTKYNVSPLLNFMQLPVVCFMNLLRGLLT